VVSGTLNASNLSGTNTGDDSPNSLYSGLTQAKFIDGTDPLDADTDDDEYSDKEEIDRNTNPLKSISNPMMRGIFIAGGVIGFLALSFVIYRTKFYKPTPKSTIGDVSSGFQVFGGSSSTGTYGNNYSAPGTSSDPNSFNFDDIGNSTAQNAKFKFCTSCGAPVPAGKEIFCTSCGHRLI